MATRTVKRLRIGWREWIQLPELCATPIKAKIDTGARTSALHAFGLDVREEGGDAVAVFDLYPLQRSRQGAVRVELPIVGFRRVRSSNGRVETRPLIVTPARVGSVERPIEVTLASRDEMGFRMLLGRAALRGRFLVDPGRSFLVTAARRRRRRQP